MNCQEALNLLYDVIDKEANEVDSKEVHNHLDKCGHCLDKFQFERTFQEFLNVRLSNGEKASEKLDTLKSRISKQLDNEDNGRTKESRSFFRSWQRMAVAAVALIVMVGVSLAASGWYRHRALFIPLEDAHFAAVAGAELAPDMLDPNPEVSFASDNWSFQTAEKIGDFLLVGGAKIELSGTTLCHFLYSDGMNDISVFVACGDEYEIPESLRGSSVMVDGLEVFHHFCDHCHLQFVDLGSAIVIAASSDPELDLHPFVQKRQSI